ncbi:transcription factor bHLH118-like [Macadamia integrifolia]|uniref:transcription factor bHLH118-like n=1 Tax=Macadamia integrifolia TaxID=60698 RepID=UPI001C4EEC29|nr:transcription factor bHLH118-like [Macadamia integrifolia]
MGERPKRRDFIPPSPIFPFQQAAHDLFVQASSSIPPYSYHSSTDPPPLNLDITEGGRCKPSTTPNSSDETCKEKNKKRIMHRDLERQRRQEMTILYASLRSLLPLQYLKGKRAISDHMNEAANYITDLRKRIQQLSSKRDGLRNVPNSSGGRDFVVTGNCPPENCVTVRPCLGGVEFVISSGLRNEELIPLSIVLRVLVDHGFSVISCVSTTVDERSLHTIHSEVSNDLTSVDLSALQQILIDLIASSSN